MCVVYPYEISSLSSLIHLSVLYDPGSANVVAIGKLIDHCCLIFVSLLFYY